MFKKILFSLIMFFMAGVCFAQAATQDLPLDAIFGALLNWKTGGLMALMIAVLNLIVYLFKSPLLGNLFSSLKEFPKIRSAILVILGVVLGILQMILTGSSIGTAIFAGLITSGGAVAIYELAIKPFFAKDKVVEAPKA